MSESLWIDHPRDLVRQLHLSVAERAPVETALAAEFAARTQDIGKRFQAAMAENTVRFEGERSTIEAEQTATRRQIAARFQQAHSAARNEHEESRQTIASAFEEGRNAAKGATQEARWEASTIFEVTKKSLDARRKQREAEVAQHAAALEALGREAQAIVVRRGYRVEPPQVEATQVPSGEAEQAAQFQELSGQLRSQLRALARQPVARLCDGGGLIGFFLLMLMVTVLPTGSQLGWTYWPGIAVSGVFALAVWGGLAWWLTRIVGRQTRQGYQAICRTAVDAETTLRVIRDGVKAAWERQTAEATAKLNAELKAANDRFLTAQAELDAKRQADLDAVEKKYPALLAEIVARRDRSLEELAQRSAARMTDAVNRCQDEANRLRHENQCQTKEFVDDHQRRWQAMADLWRSGMGRVEAGVDHMQASCGRHFPDWQATAWDGWKPPSVMPAAVPFGDLSVSLNRLEGGVPQDPRLKGDRTEFDVPALFPFGEHSALLLKVAGDGRNPAVETLQAVMLRLLTSMPPGKVRFTIIDPVGLGENFSAFMHLADFNDKLVTSRIWTDATHVDERLAELTGHMENVLQVYLRNEFATIQEYNDFAGELAEPYRILVVANFPTNFSELAARRLTSIVASGARCGVYTLLSVDTRLRMPREFHLADLEKHALTLRWDEDRFVWDDPDFAEWPLAMAGPPQAERFTEIVRTVGRHVRDSDRVEVPFENVAPQPEQWWTADSRSGIDVPLGRAGAMKLQHLQLGKGTSQHVLISGKTGSGKSTLLHALITNLALRYSPSEIELFLIDFKKGVEFKAYAQSGLPHARVIAIESEREFGLSVLERLDLELKIRGDLFRKENVQDIAAFRTARPEIRLPRMMLIVDEFQELFVEDDRIAQNAALLLDRLVRQGRAFGIHVLLGSQTLAGAYSLPRSTIGQMAVRIALQCSESDAHLILSEENTAAKLLNRPGEAIYNDANGLYEGNHPFQVVWLPDQRRETYLDRIGDLACQRNVPTRQAIVFEGNVPADLSRNVALTGMLTAAGWPAPSRVSRAWLGDAVSIKAPTSVAFARQSGSHLLLVGQNEDDALGVMSAAAISLAAQHPDAAERTDPQPDGANGHFDAARFFILDGTRADSPTLGSWERLAAVLPHETTLVNPRSSGDALAQIGAELARREAHGGDDFPPVFLFVFDVARFRNLRKSDDDFSFGRYDEDKPVSPAKVFQKILHDGPPVGIHVLIWSDSFNNVQRHFDRQALQDIEYRAVFQMNGSDSSNLIDTAAASQLGPHRGLIFNESDGTLEKFRPYGPPSAEYLAMVAERLRARQVAGASANRV